MLSVRLVSLLVLLLTTQLSVAQLTFDRHTMTSSLFQQVDLNDDGIPDFVGFEDSAAALSSFAVTPSQGGGRYAPPVVYHFVPGTDFAGRPKVLVGDFNRDGEADLLIPTCCNGFQLFLGHGDGTLQGPTLITDDVRAITAATLDVNHDGKLDIVYADFSNVYLRLGHGDGSFGPRALITADPNIVIQDMAAGNFDGDRNGDVAVIARCATTVCRGIVKGLYGDGKGHFQVVTTHFPLTPDNQYVSVADIDNDGLTDLAVWGASNLFTYELLLAQGGRTFQHQTLPLGFDGSTGPKLPPTFADWNGDGFNDLGILSATGLVYRLGHPTGFGPLHTFTYQESGLPTFVLTGDYNRDGRPDIAVDNFANNPRRQIDLLLNTTPGTFPHCFAPAPQGVSICNPKVNSTNGSKVHFSIRASSFVLLDRIELWIDGHKATEIHRDSLEVTLNVTAGQHRATAHAVTIDGGILADKVNFVVQ